MSLESNWAEPVAVVHVFGVMDPGGAELRTIELMEAMGDSVVPTYVTLSGRPGSLRGRIEDSGGRVEPMPLGPGFPRRFVGLLRDQRPDVLHSHIQDFSGVLVSAGRLARVPSRISHYHSDGDGAVSTIRRRAYRRAMKRLVHANSTAIVGVSPTTLDSVWGPAWRNDPVFSVIPNAFAATPRATLDSLRRRFGIPERAPLMANVGRPAPEKNRAFLIEVLAALPDATHLVFVGPEDRVADDLLSQAATTAGLADRVHFAGFEPDVQNLMRQIDVLLIPSVREGLPGVAVEACVVGTPVVANDLPWAAYIAEHLGGVTTIPLEGGATKWADAVGAAIQRPRPDPREALRAFQRSPFQMSSAVPRWTELYRGTAPP